MPLSRVIEDIFTDAFKPEELESSRYQQKLCLIYVDVSFTVYTIPEILFYNNK